LGRLAQRIWAGGEVFIEGIAGLAGIQRGGAVHVSWNVWCVAPELGTSHRKPQKTMSTKRQPGDCHNRWYSLALCGCMREFSWWRFVLVRSSPLRFVHFDGKNAIFCRPGRDSIAGAASPGVALQTRNLTGTHYGDFSLRHSRGIRSVLIEESRCP